MNLELSTDQQMMVDTFGKFFRAYSSPSQVRAALPLGFDKALWKRLSDMGLPGIRVSDAAGGLGLGLLDAVLIMEEAGRWLASAPLAEAIVAARLIERVGGPRELLDRILAGDAVVVLALHDAATTPSQWVNGAAVADVIIARSGDRLVAVRGRGEPAPRNLASSPLARVDFTGPGAEVLATGAGAVAAFEAAVEEWKLLTAMALCGLSRAAITLACDYACERHQFGRPIGSFQGVAHPLADASVYTDAAKYAVWEVICSIAGGDPRSGAKVSMAYWLCCDASARAVAQAVHTFGGYGVTLDYDIHLFSLRAKSWSLAYGDPAASLAECGRRLYGGDVVSLPDAGDPGISYSLGDDAVALAAETRAFFEKELSPAMRAKAHYSWAGHDPELHRKAAAARLLFPAWPEELGGRNASPCAARASLDVWEEFEWTTHGQGTCNMVGHVMRLFGSEELKGDALAKVARGEATCALGFSEPASGSDVFAATTKATPEGNGWRIDGQKMFTSGGEVADYVLLLARTDASGAKHEGLTMFLVPLDAPGVDIQPVETFPDEPTTITYYDGVRVPDSFRLGDVGGGTRVIGAALQIEQGVSFVNYHRRMLEKAEAYCRTALAGSVPLIDQPHVRARLARVAAHVLAATAITHRSQWASANNLANKAFGPSTKVFTSERYRVDAEDLLDLLAPQSLIQDAGPAAFVNQCFRHAQLTTIYAGTSEVHRSVIAEKQLGLPRTRA